MRHHHDVVRLHHRMQAVRDHQHGAAPAQSGQGVLHQRLILGIDAGRGFVQQQDRRVLEQRPGNRQALALSARQPRAALTDAGLIAVRQRHDERVRAGRPRGAFQLRGAGVGPRQAQVVGNGAVEQEHVLEHHADLGQQRIQRPVAHIASAHPHRAGADVVQPGQQPRQRALARSARAHEGGQPARLGPQRHAVQRQPLAIAMADGVVLDMERTGRHGAVGFVRQCRLGQHGVDIGQRLRPLRLLAQRERQAQQGLQHRGRQQQEQEQGRDVQRPARMQPRAQGRHQQQVGRQQPDVQLPAAGAGTRVLRHPVRRAADGDGQPAEGTRVQPERFHNLHPAHVFADLVGDLALQRVPASRPAGGLPHQDGLRRQRRRQGRDRGQCQAPIHPEQQRQRRQRHHGRGHRVGQHVGQKALQAVHVVRQHPPQATTAARREKRQRHPAELARQRQPQAMLDTEGAAVRQDVAGCHGSPAQCQRGQRPAGQAAHMRQIGRRREPFQRHPIDQPERRHAQRRREDRGRHRQAQQPGGMPDQAGEAVAARVHHRIRRLRGCAGRGRRRPLGRGTRVAPCRGRAHRAPSSRRRPNPISSRATSATAQASANASR